MGLGVPGAEPQAVATASGGVRASARQWDRAKIIPIGGLAGLCGPSRVPCLPLRPCGVPALVSIPASNSGPSIRSRSLNYLSTAQTPRLDGAVESLGKNTGAAQMPKLAGPHMPHLPQTGSRGTRLPVATRFLPPSDFTCRHGAGRLFRSGQAEDRRVAEQRPRRFETMEAPAGQSILFFRRLPRRRSDDTAPALRFDRGPFRDLPKRPAQHAHLSVGALCGPFGPRRQRLGDWLSPIRSASVGHEYEKLR